MFGKNIACDDIEGKRLLLQPYGKDRAQAMTVWVNDPEITRYLGSDFGQTPEQEDKWVDRMAEAEDQCQWGIFWDGRHIGNAGLMDIRAVDRNAVYGILIGERECWGKGIGTEVAKAIAAYAFETLNLERLYADVFLPNEGSKVALERAGFKEYGIRPGAKFIGGEYRDEWKCCLSLTEWKERK